MDRFREATGKDVGALEAEKAARGALESRTQAQVRRGRWLCSTVAHVEHQMHAARDWRCSICSPQILNPPSSSCAPAHPILCTR